MSSVARVVFQRRHNATFAAVLRDPYISLIMLDDLIQPNIFELVVWLLILWHLLLERREQAPRDKRFRRLALRFHPERLAASAGQCDCDDALDAFSTVAEAFEVLSDPLKKAVYDQYGEHGLKNGVVLPDTEDCFDPYSYHGQPLRTYRDFFGTDNPYANLLDHFADPPPRKSCPAAEGKKKKDDPIIKKLPLTLEEVFYGGVKKLKIQRMVLVGGEAGGDEGECNQWDLAPTTKLEDKILSIRVMPGMPSGSNIVFPEEGDQSPTKIPADIIFVTEDKPHKTFQREGSNLRLTVNVFLSEALTGTIVSVRTIDDRILRVPITSVISPGFEKKVLGEGLPLVEDPESRGDLIIDFKIEFPAYLSAASRSFVQMAFEYEYEDESAEDDLGLTSSAVHRMVMDGKTYMRAKKLTQVCRP